MYTHIYTGAPITFPLRVRPARNFPIDLYLLMDLSFSMSDDLDNLKRLGADLGMHYMCVHLQSIYVAVAGRK